MQDGGRYRERVFAASIISVSIFLALLSSGCTSQRVIEPDNRPVRIETESPQTFARQDFPEDLGLDLIDDDIPYEGLVLEDAAGNLRKFYYLRPGRYAAISSLITEITGVPADRLQYKKEWGEAGQGSPGYELMLVKGTEEEFSEIDAFLEHVEAQTPMIEIEAQIVELLNTDDFQFGIQTAISEIANNGGFNDETLFDQITGIFDTDSFQQAQLVGSDFQGFLMNLGTLHDEFRYDILIQALASKRLAKILSAPKITVIAGFPAEITIGDEVPIQTFKTVAGTAIIDVSFKQAAVSLTVTPQIVGNDTVRMDIKPEVSRITGFTDPGPRGLSNPIISTRNAKTTVNVRDGYTYVIGGLIGNTEIKEELKTPLLGDIPILRHLFRTTSTTTTDTNLLFIIKPKIIRPVYYGAVSDRIFEPDIPLDDEDLDE